MGLNKLYPKQYGGWAGNPRGTPPDYRLCCETVSARESFGRRYQCTRPRGYGPDKAYCKQHDPAVVKARLLKSREASEKKFNEERVKYSGQLFYNTLRKIADGHNDARGLANQVLADFHERDFSWD